MAVLPKKQRATIAAGQEALDYLAEGLVKRLPSLAPEAKRSIAIALDEILAGQNEQAHRVRVGMQHYLIEVAALHEPPASVANADLMLTTEEAADLMQCSRPTVAMLIDNNKLAGAKVTAGGHRRVSAASVQAWINERVVSGPQSDYRTVASQAGMYTIPE